MHATACRRSTYSSALQNFSFPPLFPAFSFSIRALAIVTTLHSNNSGSIYIVLLNSSDRSHYITVDDVVPLDGDIVVTIGSTLLMLRRRAVIAWKRQDETTTATTMPTRNIKHNRQRKTKRELFTRGNWEMFGVASHCIVQLWGDYTLTKLYSTSRLYSVCVEASRLRNTVARNCKQ